MLPTPSASRHDSFRFGVYIYISRLTLRDLVQGVLLAVLALAVAVFSRIHQHVYSSLGVWSITLSARRGCGSISNSISGKPSSPRSSIVVSVFSLSDVFFDAFSSQRGYIVSGRGFGSRIFVGGWGRLASTLTSCGSWECSPGGQKRVSIVMKSARFLTTYHFDGIDKVPASTGW